MVVAEVLLVADWLRELGRRIPLSKGKLPLLSLSY